MSAILEHETSAPPQTVRCEVISVNNERTSCQRKGDTFIWSDRTPCDMCTKAFHSVYPIAMAVRGSAGIKNNGKEESHIDVPCPDGHVIFRLSRL